MIDIIERGIQLSEPFKICPNCKMIWNSRADFISDDSLDIAGYLFSKKKVDDGIFMFCHRIDTCGTTLSLKVKVFVDLYDGETYSENLHGTPRCGKLCVDKNNFSDCHNPCANRYVRVILEKLHQKGYKTKSG